ncbi:MAG: acetylxylan esterase, partial [Chloroflexi bacterium]|nr:acetylxylan esterase [Chloroflexota bacterium]
ETWWARRRPEILRIFEEEMFGHAPVPPDDMRFVVTSVEPKALDGRATRKEISIYLTASDTPRLDVLLYIPNGQPRPVPAFVGLNSHGNQSVHADPGITLYGGWVPEFPAVVGDLGVENNRATERSRGVSAEMSYVEGILARGYAVATMCTGDIVPDRAEPVPTGIQAALLKPGQRQLAPNEWGTIAAWSWGMSRILDYLVTDPDIDGSRVAVQGTSRLGKAALWAGAVDQRFALVIPNESGCCGTAISRRKYGETFKSINESFPSWLCKSFHKYSEREDEFPADQHMLVALVAPRPVYVASAVDDLWCDPRGEFLGAKNAAGVYRLLGTDGFAAEEMPGLHEPIRSTISYHIRAGGHGIMAYDWDRFLDFADSHMVRRTTD